MLASGTSPSNVFRSFRLRSVRFVGAGLRPAAASASAGVNILVLPTRMVPIGIKPPAEDEMLTVLVVFLDGPHRLLDQPRQLAVFRVSAFIGGVDVLGVGLDAGKRQAPLARRRLASRAFHRRAAELRVDFRHCRPPRSGFYAS